LNTFEVNDFFIGGIFLTFSPYETELVITVNLTIRECFNLLEGITGLSVPKCKFPYFIALAKGLVSERLLRTSAPSFIARDVDSAKASRLYWYFDSSKAVRDLRFHQMPIEKTVERTVRSLKDFGYLDG
jgi:hypothetical protein